MRSRRSRDDRPYPPGANVGAHRHRLSQARLRRSRCRVPQADEQAPPAGCGLPQAGTRPERLGLERLVTGVRLSLPAGLSRLRGRCPVCRFLPDLAAPPGAGLGEIRGKSCPDPPTCPSRAPGCAPENLAKPRTAPPRPPRQRATTPGRSRRAEAGAGAAGTPGKVRQRAVAPGSHRGATRCGVSRAGASVIGGFPRLTLIDYHW